MNTQNILEFKIKEKTPKKVVFEIIGFTEFGNRNGMYFDMEDLLLGASKIPVKITHEGEVVADTYLENRKLKDTKQGKIMYGEVTSTNPEFIKQADKITGFSIEGEALNDSYFFMNEKGEALIKKGGFDFQAIAALTGGLPGSGGTEILNKKFEFKLVKVGSEDADDKDTNLNNNTMTDEQLQQIQSTIKEAVKEEVKLTFASMKEQEEAKNKVEFSFNKNVKPEVIAEKIKETFGYEFALKEEEAVKKSEEAKNVAFSKTEPVKAGNKAEEEPKEEKLTITI